MTKTAEDIMTSTGALSYGPLSSSVMTPTQTLGKLQKCGRKCYVFMCSGRFHKGRTSITDDLRNGGQHGSAHY